MIDIAEVREIAARMLSFTEDERLPFHLRYRAAMMYEQANTIIAILQSREPGARHAS